MLNFCDGFLIRSGYLNLFHSLNLQICCKDTLYFALLQGKGK